MQIGNWSSKKRSEKSGDETYNLPKQQEFCHSERSGESLFDRNSKEDKQNNGAQGAPECSLPGISAGEPGRRVQLWERKDTIKIVYLSTILYNFLLYPANRGTCKSALSPEIQVAPANYKIPTFKSEASNLNPRFSNPLRASGVKSLVLISNLKFQISNLLLACDLRFLAPISNFRFRLSPATLTHKGELTCATQSHAQQS